MLDTDLEAVIKLVQEASAYAWSPKLIQDSLRAVNDRCLLLGRSGTGGSDNEIVGYSAVYTVLDECHLLNIVVKKSEQGQGLGTVFLQRVLEIFASQQCTFFLEVRASNAAAIRLYEKAGFRKNGVRKAYYPTGGGREDAWLYSLSLAEVSG